MNVIGQLAAALMVATVILVECGENPANEENPIKVSGIVRFLPFRIVMILCTRKDEFTLANSRLVKPVKQSSTFVFLPPIYLSFVERGRGEVGKCRGQRGERLYVLPLGSKARQSPIPQATLYSPAVIMEIGFLASLS